MPLREVHALSNAQNLRSIMRAATSEAPAAVLAHPPRPPQPRPRLSKARGQRFQKRTSQAAGRLTVRASGFDGRPVAPVATPPPVGTSRRRSIRGSLLSAALLSAAAMAITLVGSSTGRGSVGATGTSTTEPAGDVRMAVVAPLQQTSPFSVSWAEVLEHAGQRLGWSEPSIRLTLYDSARLPAGDAAASAALQAALAGSQAVLALGIQDPAEAAALAPLLAGAPTAVALGSAAALERATRLGGRVPAARSAEGSNPLAAVLAKVFPDKQAKLDAQVGAWKSTCHRPIQANLLPSVLLLLRNAVRPAARAASLRHALLQRQLARGRATFWQLSPWCKF